MCFGMYDKIFLFGIKDIFKRQWYLIVAFVAIWQLAPNVAPTIAIWLALFRPDSGLRKRCRGHRSTSSWNRVSLHITHDTTSLAIEPLFLDHSPHMRKQLRAPHRR